jgi:3D (Asp-Asp-Asp) domain-containing protein
MICSNSWYITGYYTPFEEQFSGPSETIEVLEKGTNTFPSDFLRFARLEGWAKTRFGWYLGYYSGKYHSSPDPLNAVGEPLHEGKSLAVDTRVIKYGTPVRIPGLPTPWNDKLFIADDGGRMINRKHVDVYCGLGPDKKAETERITGGNRRLCRRRRPASM